MNKHLFVMLSILVGALAMGCNDAAPISASIDGDAMFDGGMPMDDGMVVMPTQDAGMDATTVVDAGIDVGKDSGMDSGMDAGVDAAQPPQDAGMDSSTPACTCSGVTDCCDGCHMINGGLPCNDNDAWTAYAVCVYPGMCSAQGPRNECLHTATDTENLCCQPTGPNGQLQIRNIGVSCNGTWWSTSHCGTEGQCYLIPLGDCSDGYTFRPIGTIVDVRDTAACVTINGQPHAQRYRTTYTCNGTENSTPSTEITRDRTCENYCNPNGVICDQGL